MGSKSGHDRRKARPTAGVGLAISIASVGPNPRPTRSFLTVGLRWLCKSFFDFGIFHFNLVWVNAFYFLHLIRFHVKIKCYKMKGLYNNRTIGLSIFNTDFNLL